MLYRSSSRSSSSSASSRESRHLSRSSRVAGIFNPIHYEYLYARRSFVPLWKKLVRWSFWAYLLWGIGWGIYLLF